MSGIIEAFRNLPGGHKSGLKVEYTSVTSVTIQAGICRDSTDSVDIELAGTKVVAITTLGAANGLDTGAEAALTLYYVHIISKDDGTTDGLLSLSRTNPTKPSGYTAFRHIGHVVNSGTSNFIDFVTEGLGRDVRYHYREGTLSTRVLSAGSATDFTAVDCSAFVPDNARTADLMIFVINSTSDVFTLITLRPDSNTATPRTLFQTDKTANTLRSFTTANMPLSVTQTLDYKVGNSNNAAILEIASMTLEL